MADEPDIYVTLRNGTVEVRSLALSVYAKIKALYDVSPSAAQELLNRANDPIYGGEAWIAALPLIVDNGLIQMDGFLHSTVVNVIQSCLIDGIIMDPIVIEGPPVTR